MPEKRKERSVPRLCLDTLSHFFLLGCVFLVVLLLQAGALVLIPFRRQPWVPVVLQFLFRRVLAGLWGLGGALGLVQVAIQGEAVRDRPVVFVANHPSFMDALFLFPYLPPKTACFYKAALERTLLPASLIRRAGFISNAGSVENVRLGAKRLRHGWCVLQFPEGTRTAAPPMGPWKTSYALMAARAPAPIQPVYIEMDPPLLPKGQPWWKPTRFPVRVRVKFGLSISAPSEHTTRSFHREMEASFRNELVQFQTPAAEPGD